MEFDKPDKFVKQIPLARGVYELFESLKLSVESLEYSAEFYGNDTFEETTLDKILIKLFGKHTKKLVSAVTATISFFVCLALFCCVPFLFSRFMERYIINTSVISIIECVVAVLILLAYILIFRSLKIVKRIMRYHAAEHQCINCIERGRKLTFKNVAASSRILRGCESNFLYTAILFSAILFMFIRIDYLPVRLLIRLAYIPIATGVFYEIYLLVKKFDNPFTRALAAPGMVFQLITTRRSDDEMINTAIKAVNEVFDWKTFLVENFPEKYSPDDFNLNKKDTSKVLDDLTKIKEELDAKYPDTEPEEKEEELEENYFEEEMYMGDPDEYYTGEKQFGQNGYYTENGEYIEGEYYIEEDGYYEGGYYNEDGEYVEGEYYVANDEYYEENGEYVEDAYYAEDEYSQGEGEFYEGMLYDEYIPESGSPLNIEPMKEEETSQADEEASVEAKPLAEEETSQAEESLPAEDETSLTEEEQSSADEEPSHTDEEPSLDAMVMDEDYEPDFVPLSEMEVEEEEEVKIEDILKSREEIKKKKNKKKHKKSKDKEEYSNEASPSVEEKQNNEDSFTKVEEEKKANSSTNVREEKRAEVEVSETKAEAEKDMERTQPIKVDFTDDYGFSPEDEDLDENTMRFAPVDESVIKGIEVTLPNRDEEEESDGPLFSKDIQSIPMPDRLDNIVEYIPEGGVTSRIYGYEEVEITSDEDEEEDFENIIDENGHFTVKDTDAFERKIDEEFDEMFKRLGLDIDD